MIKVIITVLVSFLIGFFGINLIRLKTVPIFTPSPTPLPKPIVIGWMSYWDEVNSYQRLINIIDKLEIFSPMLYQVGVNGRLTKYSIRTRTQTLELARKNNILLLPTIGDDGDRSRVKLLLTDNFVQDQFISDLITEAKKEGFIGWALDIEKLSASDKDDFSKFVKRVGENLHSNGLLLHTIVYARVANESYPPARAHDYIAIGGTSDKVILMTYNFHNELTDPGAQTPPSWLRDVLKYATSVIPKEKIVVGLSTHGYVWEGKRVRGLTYPEVEDWLTDHHKQAELIQNEMAVRLKDDTAEMWFENGETIWKKIQLVQKKFDIHQFALWRIGADDVTIWNYF